MIRHFKIAQWSERLGFSMVELSAVLTIVGITLAGALDLATRKTESDRITETNARMDIIEDALEVYLINNQRLPCPADATQALSSITAGTAGAASRSGALGVCAGSNFPASGSVYSGMVPTKALGLPDKMMADDWDRRFTYVVDARFANNYTTNGSCTSSVCFKQATAGGITVNDSTGTARTTEAIYTIISHGKNGYGAWKYTGVSRLAQPAAPDASEQSNAGDDAGSFDAIFVQKDSTTTFDDIARYKTKAVIISDVSGITDSTTCTAAFDNVNAGLTDPCVGLSGGPLTNCNALGAQVNNYCLQP